jgi:hypothetical protein
MIGVALNKWHQSVPTILLKTKGNIMNTARVTLSTKERKALSAYLMHLATDGGVRGEGICGHVWVKFAGNQTEKWFDENIYDMCALWEHNSGSWGFPVPSDIPAQTACNRFIHSCDMWDGEYGRMRRKLAEFLSKEVLTHGLGGA